MKIRPIKTEEDYREALARLNEIFDAAPGTEASDEADVLALLIDDYERKNFSIEAPDPIEAIRIRMEEMGLRQHDLAGEVGGQNRISEILNRKRRLTVRMIRNLARRLDLPAEVLIRDYRLSG